MLILLDIVYFICHIPTITQPLSMEDIMGFKKMDKSLDFADFVLANSLKHNRSLAIMENQLWKTSIKPLTGQESNPSC